MEISQEELQRRLNSRKNLTNSLKGTGDRTSTLPQSPSGSKSSNPVVVPLHKDRAEQKPREARALAGILAAQGEPVSEVARLMQMTPNQVRTATKSPKLPEVTSTVEKVREIALDKVMTALNLMTEDKFENASLKDLSMVASNVSKIIEKTSPKESGPTVQLLVYAPQQREENFYKVLDV